MEHNSKNSELVLNLAAFHIHKISFMVPLSKCVMGWEVIVGLEVISSITI